MTGADTLDIQAGGPFGEAMVRSTMTADFPIAPDGQELPLPSLASWSGNWHYQLVLQTGSEQSIPIPWTPSGGTIWTNFGVIDEINLDFAHFDLSRADSESGNCDRTLLRARSQIPDDLRAALPMVTNPSMIEGKALGFEPCG